MGRCRMSGAACCCRRPKSTFCARLQLAAREDWLIFSMVRLADIIKVRPRTRKFQTWNSRHSRQASRFCALRLRNAGCQAGDRAGRPGRAQPTAAARDRFVNTALAAAGVPLLRIKVQEKYETAVLRKDMEDVLGIMRKKKRA